MKMTIKKVEKLTVYTFDTREEMGKVAAADAARRINDIIARNGVANVVFAAAPSQNDLLENLLKSDIDWTKVRAFHQDEYVGISAEEPAGFGNFLDRAIFKKVNFKELHYLLCDADEAEKKCQEYTELLRQYPIDLIFLGIGENGHLAFNDPAVADFNDPKMVKIVELDEVCRQQQVNDGCFEKLEQVPTHALTVTIPGLTQATAMFCSVPAATKADAINHMVHDEVSTKCPATILRTHTCAKLYVDKAAGAFVIE